MYHVKDNGDYAEVLSSVNPWERRQETLQMGSTKWRNFRSKRMGR